MANMSRRARCVCVCAADEPEFYLDSRDAAWVLKGTEPKLIEPGSVTPERFIAYRLGLFAMKLFEKKLGFPQPAFYLAASLPEVSASLLNNYHHNAYRRSFFYDQAAKALHIRIERLDSVGGFVLVLAHALAHAHVGSFADDREHAFMREFNRALEIICADMCGSRTAVPLTAGGTDLEKKLGKLLASHGFETPDVEEKMALAETLLRVGAIDKSELPLVSKMQADLEHQKASAELETLRAKVEKMEKKNALPGAMILDLPVDQLRKAERVARKTGLTSCACLHV